mmetsp:Transcript_5014/g.18818  ORF Transcript_5014/g.18818 Transcript_5014/m.18818 type:complete len:383 (-) Transcript_5014:139-1287(-)
MTNTNAALNNEEPVDKTDIPTPSANAHMRISLDHMTNARNIPPPLDGHRAIAYPPQGTNQKIYLYGGGSYDAKTNKYIYYDKFYVYDSMANEWHQVESKLSSENPPPLIAFSMTLRDLNQDPSIVVFGGTSVNRTRVNHVFEFCLTRHEWKRLKCSGSIPPSLTGHTAHWHPEADHMYVFCGRDADHHHLEDVLRLDLKTLVWAPVQTKGDRPPGRISHTSVLWKNNYVILFGGEDGDDTFFDDTWLFNIASEEWTNLTTTGDKPSKRCYHAAVIHQDKMYIYGGHHENNELFMLDLNVMRWKKLRIDPHVPEELRVHGHSLCVLQSSEADYPRLLVFGGSNIKERQLDRFYAFELRNYEHRFQYLLCEGQHFTDSVVVCHQ